MIKKIIVLLSFASILASCESNLEKNNAQIDHLHDTKNQFIAYSTNIELFAEADPFVVGKSSNVLSHFSNLPDFSALESGFVSIKLVVNGLETKQKLDKPTRNGIYSFEIIPEIEGLGELIFDLNTERGEFQLIVPNIKVFIDKHEAYEHAEEGELSSVNAVVFTKEQSWKVNFATELPEKKSIGQIVKTTGLVQAAQGDEIILSALTNGVVELFNESVVTGNAVSSGQKLFSISGSGLADDNSNVRFLEAKNNYEKAKSNYLRLKELEKDKIVSEKDLLIAKNQFENSKLIYNNLSKNFNSSGQIIASPMIGFVKELFVNNGQYVETGQPVVSIAQNKTQIIVAEISQKYTSLLAAIKDANIRTLYDSKTYKLNDLNGKIISYGKNANSSNYLIPISIQIDNTGIIFPGSFVEVYLKSITNTEALTIPNSSLLEDHGVFYVFAQITPELFERREVIPGTTDGIRTEILDGISVNERIVSKGGIQINLAKTTGTLDAHSGHVH